MVGQWQGHLPTGPAGAGSRILPFPVWCLINLSKKRSKILLFLVSGANSFGAFFSLASGIPTPVSRWKKNVARLLRHLVSKGKNGSPTHSGLHTLLYLFRWRDLPFAPAMVVRFFSRSTFMLQVLPGVRTSALSWMLCPLPLGPAERVWAVFGSCLQATRISACFRSTSS